MRNILEYANNIQEKYVKNISKEQNRFQRQGKTIEILLGRNTCREQKFVMNKKDNI